MRRMLLTTMIALYGMWWSATAAFAQVPALIRYQGQAVDSHGVPLEGPYTLTFRLYDAETGGVKIWEETQTNVPLTGGHFSVLLGQVASLDATDWSQPRWLSVQVNSDPELVPRQRITSVPLAMRAKTAEELANGERGARVYHDASQSIADRTDTIVAFNSEEWDTDGIHDPVTNNTRLVTKTAGKYLITAQVGFAYNPSGFRQIYLRVNGWRIIGVDLVMPVTIPGQGTFLQITTTQDLAANDYVELRAYQTSGGPLTIFSDASYSPEFSMVKLQ